MLTRLRRMVFALALIAALPFAALPLAASAAPFKIAVDENFPPFIQMQAGKPAGLGIALLEAAASRTGLELRFIPKPFAQIQAAVEMGEADAGEADAIFPLTANPQRLERFHFSEPLISTGGALFVRHPEATPANVHALHGQSILTPKTGPLGNALRRMAPNIALIETQDYDETLKRLMSGEARAAALNLQVGRQLVSAHYAGQITLPEHYFWEVSLSVAILKTASAQQENLARLNTGIRAILADGSWKSLTDAYNVFVPQ